MTAVVLVPPTSSAAAVDVVPSPSSKTSNSSTIANDANSNQNVEMALAGGEERIDCAEKEVAEQSENNERQGNTGAESTNETPRASATKRAATSSEPRHKKRPRVSFDRADIVEFEPTIYTTTVTSGGIPVGMSFTERSRTRRRLDSWELERTEARVGRQNYMEEGYLDPTERETILNKTGCDEPTMVVVEAEVNRIIAHRRESNEIDFEFMYGLGEVGDSLVEEEDEEEEEDEVNNQEGDEHDDEDEEQGDNEEKEPQEGAEEGSGGAGLSSEEGEKDSGDEGTFGGSRSDVSDQARP
uniref:Uncharacterized protein n=1 Tax=Globisporangium ultimum (strain ATCC 200006 / CBS 805.95 / DAOM BR144) TaxID=431595 RepID=K3XB67_GLOUD